MDEDNKLSQDNSKEAPEPNKAVPQEPAPGQPVSTLSDLEDKPFEEPTLAQPTSNVEDQQQNISPVSSIQKGSSPSSNYFSETPTYLQNQADSSSGNKKKMLILGGLVVLALAVLGGGYFFLQSRNEKSKSETPKIESPVTTPVPTEEEDKINRSEWKLEVLNGSGVTGAAGTLAKKLEDLGYEVIKTGNADKQTYKTSELYISKELLEKSALFIKDIEELVKVSSVSGQLKDSTASARIILGKDND